MGTGESIEAQLKAAKKEVFMPAFAKLLKQRPDQRAIEQKAFDVFSNFLDKLASETTLTRDVLKSSKEL